MKRTYFYTVLLFFLVSISYSRNIPRVQVQNNSFKLELRFDLKHTDENTGKFTVRKYSDVSDEICSQQYLLPSRDIFIAIPVDTRPIISAVSSKSMILQNVVPVVNKRFHDISKESNLQNKRGIVNSNDVSSKLYETIGYVWIRDFYCVHLRIFPVAYDGQMTENYSIIISVELPGISSLKDNSPIDVKSPFDKSLDETIFNAQIAEQFRNTSVKIYPDTTGTWIDYAAMYVKIPIINDDIYQISNSDILKVGIDASSIDCTTFQMFESGREIPLYIKGEQDGRLDNGDFIQFYAAKNYSKKSYRAINANGEAYNNFMNMYTDTSFYFLTWGSKKGKRMPVSSEAYQTITDTLNYHTAYEHFETDAGFGGLNTDLMKNQDPHWIETDLWYWGGVSSGSQADFLFNAVNLLQNKTAKIYLKVIGNASGRISNSHELNLLLNLAVIDSKFLTRNERALLQGAFNSSSLINGTNTLTLKNVDNGNTPNVVVYDWFDVEYPQKLVASNNRMRINFLYDIVPGVKLIKIENFNKSNISIFKIAPRFKHISNYSIRNGTLIFGDTVSFGDKYIVLSDDNIQTPSLSIPIKFENLRSVNNKYDDIIITNEVLKNSTEEYAQLINSRYNLRTKAFYTKDIFNEFGYGYPSAESIQEFLKYAYQNWQPPKPSYVFLVGSANYDYKNIFKKTKLNLVPSYGEPVSDAWYTIWGDAANPLQQMWIGRIPAADNDEVRFYLNKHKEYLSQRYTSFNKSAMFFSGGDPNTPGQIESFREVNDFVKNNITNVAPYYMNGVHFYKTRNPQSDFGPYDSKFVQNTIKNGALFISYLGHSGTRVWDNSITQTADLENNYNRFPMITDFGCSTAKFAEPDVDAFPNLFVLQSQAIAYIGNSSLGYTSTSLTAPKYFYESVFTDSIFNIGRAHALTKQKILENLGTGGAYNIFKFTNTLIGDPVVNLFVPPKPNIVITGNDIVLGSTNLNDLMDFVQVKFTVHNFGLQSTKTIKILIKDEYLGSTSFSDTISVLVPTDDVTLNSKIPIHNKPGPHKFTVELDYNNSINEIYKDDNTATLQYVVISMKTRPYIYDRTASSLSGIIFINPQKSSEDKPKLVAEVDESPSFSNLVRFTIPLDTFYTKLSLSQLTNGKRYWLRTRLGENNTDWEQQLSFQKSETARKLVYNDSLSENSLHLEKLATKRGVIYISSDTSLVSVESAGGNFMKYGSIKLNKTNILPNTFNWGMGIAVFDSVQIKIDTTDTFWYGDNPLRAHELAMLINLIPNGKIVAMCAIDDLSSNLTLELRNAIKTLGSTLVDNIGFRNPWLLIGKKGARSGDVIEKLETASYQNILTAEKPFIWTNKNGKVTTDIIGPASLWKNVKINAMLPGDSKIDFSVLGYKQDSGIDTLSLTNNNGIISLSSLRSKKYPRLELVGNLHLSKDGQTPMISSLSIDYAGVAELGTNYQTVWLERDTITQGEQATLTFYVYNVGESWADSFKVRVEVVKSDHTREKIFEQMVDSLSSEKRKLFNVSCNTASITGSRSFLITIDPDNKITELYKDNNLYSVPFYVKANKAPSSIKLTFDGNDILNGDYVSSNPDIKVELTDLSLIPISDTGHIQLFLNNKRISLSNKEISYSFSSSNPKFVVDYKPALSDGAYTLKVIGTNSTGQVIDSTGVVRQFLVSAQAQLLYVYNYPNPFSSETYFTFKLTQIPDELKIKIFTVSGRMIKELAVPHGNLNYDFNRIEWDGRDDDGDLVANGVYLYKVIIKKGTETIQAIQKLAVVR